MVENDYENIKWKDISLCINKDESKCDIHVTIMVVVNYM